MSNNRPIIAILTDRYHEYQATIVDLLAVELSNAGYGSLCITGKELQDLESPVSTNKTANTIYPEVNRYGISGLITLSGTLDRSQTQTALTELISKINVPVVSTGLQLANTPSVYMDESIGMTDLMNHLLANGERKRFAFIRGHQNDPYSLSREAIFRSSLEAYGLDPEDCEYVEGDYNAFKTYQAIDELFSRGVRLDCIVAANDVMAASAGRAAKTHGLSIPSELWLSGFDDTNDSTRHSPAITTIRMPLSKLVKESVSLLVQQLEPNSSMAAAPASVRISTELIVRKSTIHSDAVVATQDTMNELELRQLLIQSMHGLEMPDGLTMQDISEPLWQTLVHGGIDIIHFAESLKTHAIYHYDHWCINICDQIEAITRKILVNNQEDGRMAIVSSAVFKVREKVWALEMDRRFEMNRLQNARSDMMLELSSCADVQDICTAMDRWLTSLKTHRCFLVRYANASSTPDEYAQLIHVFRNAKSETADTTLFKSKSILPDDYQNEIRNGVLVMCPICVDDKLFGYLLLDPRDMLLLYIDAAAQCIGNAMRTYFHIGALKNQRDSLESVNEELEQLANFDLLTGLANRLQFTQYLGDCCATSSSELHGTPFSLLFIDLDGFKLINDTLGHAVGDQLLGQVAQRLLDQVAISPDYKGFISRLGGDEFTVILHKNNESADIHHITQHFLNRLASPYELDEKIVSISASIGCASYPHDATDAESIVTRADIAMYAAKDRGKNKAVFFTPDMDSADNHELQLAQDLRHALDNNELCMYYQPRIDLKTGKMCAAEALMRWLVTTPDGIVPKAYPDVFITLAEKIGVIEQLDTYALNYSCQQAAQWNAAGTPLPISVNVSVKQLQQPGFVPTIKRAIEQYNLEPSLLELEITETAAMTDVEDNIAKLTAIKSMGITISIDDFGTGYSSLNYLKRLPVDNLKIDRSFIMDIDQSDGGDSADASIVRSVVALGKSMGFGLVAEGIESEAQSNFIRGLECDQAQGFLFAKPMPVNEISQKLIDDKNDGHQDGEENQDIAA